MSLCFTINGVDFWIDEFDDGYAWVNKKSESKIGYSTQYEAQQDALNTVRRKNAEISE